MLAAGEHMAKTLSPEGSPIGRSYYLGDASSPKVQVTELLDCVWITAYPEVIPKKWGSVRIGDNSTGTRELTLSRPG
jgi:hypothetical protein